VLSVRRHRVSVSAAVISLSAALNTTLLATEANAQSAPATSAMPQPTASATQAAPAAPMLPVVGNSAATSETPSDATPPAENAATAAPGTAKSTDEYSIDPTLTFGAHKDQAVLKPPKETRWLLMAAGLATAGAWYGASYGIGALWPDARGRGDLKVPVIGPFMDLEDTRCPKSNPSCSTFGLVARAVIVGLDAIGQAGGIALILEGAIFSPSGVEPTKTNQSLGRLRRETAPSVVAIPWSDGRSGAGLGLVGRF